MCVLEMYARFIMDKNENVHSFDSTFFPRTDIYGCTMVVRFRRAALKMTFEFLVYHGIVFHFNLLDFLVILKFTVREQHLN